MVSSLVWTATVLGLATDVAGLKLAQPNFALTNQTQTTNQTGLPVTILVVDHVPKCGGTFVNHLAKSAVEGTNLHLVNESAQLTSADIGEGRFVVGMIRHPFDFYISIWAYQAYRTLISEKTFEEIRPLGEPAGSNPEDPSRLLRFIKFFSDEDLGLLSFLFYFSYLDFSGTIAQTPWNYKGTVRDAFVGMNHSEVVKVKRAIQDGLHAFSPQTSHVNCWVHTDHATDDATHCFKLYAAAGGQVNFDSFQEQLQQNYTNPGKHIGCAELYNETGRAFVQRADAELFRAFNLSLSCTM